MRSRENWLLEEDVLGEVLLVSESTGNLIFLRHPISEPLLHEDEPEHARKARERVRIWVLRHVQYRELLSREIEVQVCCNLHRVNCLKNIN